MRIHLLAAAAWLGTSAAHADPRPATSATADPSPAVAGAAAGAEASAMPAASATASASDDPHPRGLAVGVELGEPTSATVAWLMDGLSLSGAIGSGTRAGMGLSLHADAQLVVAHFTPTLPLRVGLGFRYYHHGYKPASVDELPDSHYGIRGSIAVAHESGALSLYAELAPGVDVKRTRSCSLADGPNSICPHAQESPLFLQLVIGARWAFSH
jgi:hypothetical protein